MNRASRELFLALQHFKKFVVMPDYSTVDLGHADTGRYAFKDMTQGKIDFDKVTLLQAIAKAGGPAEGAKKKGVLIKRRNKDGKEININVNLKDIIKGKKPDIDLQKGDVVYVPESKW